MKMIFLVQNINKNENVVFLYFCPNFFNKVKIYKYIYIKYINYVKKRKIKINLYIYKKKCIFKENVFKYITKNRYIFFYYF